MTALDLDAIRKREKRCALEYDPIVAKDISNLLAEIDRLQQYEGVAMSAVGVEIGGERYYVKPNVAAEIGRLTDQLAEARAVIEVAKLLDAEYDVGHAFPPDNIQALHDALLSLATPNADGEKE